MIGQLAVGLPDMDACGRIPHIVHVKALSLFTLGNQELILRRPRIWQSLAQCLVHATTHGVFGRISHIFNMKGPRAAALGKLDIISTSSTSWQRWLSGDAGRVFRREMRHFSAHRSAHFSALDGTQFLLCAVGVPMPKSSKVC